MSSIIKGRRIRSESVLSLAVRTETIPSSYNEEESKPYLQPDTSMIIQKANEEAQKIMDDAKKQADKIVAQAEHEAKKHVETTYELARQDGYKQGYEQGSKEAQHLMDKSNDVLQDAYEQKKHILKQSEPEMIELIINICRKLIDDEIQFNPNTILLLIRKAFNEVHYDATQVTIKVPQSQYNYIMENKQIIFGDHTNVENIEIWKDDTLNEGVCIVQTPYGSVECNVGEQFLQLTKQLRLLCSNE